MPDQTPNLNAALAAQVAGIIRNRPQAWNQGIWLEFNAGQGRTVAELRADCGTSACVAGWAALLAAPDTAEAAPPMYGLVRDLILPGGTVTGIKNAAKEALGLDDWTAAWLFDSERSDGEVLAALDAIARGELPELPADEDDEDDGYGV